MKLSEEIKPIFPIDKDLEVSIKKILDQVGERSFGLLFTIFALPSALPVPAPGYSIPFGFGIVFTSLGLILGKRHPWFPKSALKKKIKIRKGSRMVKGIYKFVHFFERFLKTRLTFLTEIFWIKRLTGILILLCGLSMLSPVPLTNTLPAFAVFLFGVSFLAKDGFFMILSLLAGLAGLGLSILIHALLWFLGINFTDFITQLF